MAESCCAVKPSSGPGACPACGVAGKPVGTVTLRALLRPEASGRVREAAHRFCATRGCQVAYYGPEGDQVFRVEELSVRVGQKVEEPPTPVCYCFDFTVEDIEQEIRGKGKTAIPERIRAEVKAGNCSCEVKNPQGSCCLGDVGRAVAEATRRFGEKREAPLVRTGGSKVMNRKISSLASIGAVGSAVLASSCCWLPLVLLVVGASAATLTSLTATLEAYRPAFVGAVVVLLGAAGYLTYFRRPAPAAPAAGKVESCSTSATGESCCPPVRGVTKIERFNRYALPVLSLAVLAVTVFPEKVIGLFASSPAVAPVAPVLPGRWYLFRSREGAPTSESALRAVAGVAEVRSIPEGRAILARVVPGAEVVPWPGEAQRAGPVELTLDGLRVPGMT